MLFRCDFVRSAVDYCWYVKIVSFCVFSAIKSIDIHSFLRKVDCEMCGSRKYPYPPHRRSLEIPRGRGVQRQKFPRGVGVSLEAPFPEGEETRIN